MNRVAYAVRAAHVVLLALSLLVAFCIKRKT